MRRTCQGLVPAFAVAWLPCAGWRSAPAAVAPPQPARIWRFGCRLKSLTLRAWVERLYGSADVGCALPLGSGGDAGRGRSEEHTSELQSLMRISYAVFCLKTKNR